MNAKVFSFLFNSPSEAIASSLSVPFLPSLLSLIILLSSSLLVLFVFSTKSIYVKKESILLRILFALAMLTLNFLFIRGGLGVAPNNQSVAYFSKHQILNHTALNTEWNLMSSVLSHRKEKTNPYSFLDKKLAEKYVKELYQVKKDSTTSILSIQRPNIVVFILESFTTDLTYKLGKEKGITPHFDSLMNNGFLFSKIYATGNRTDKGLIGSLTGFPSLGAGSIVSWPEKMQKIPSISQSFYRKGYQTSFFYGGESNFDNYKAFVLSHGFQKLVDKKSFDKKDMNSKWGVYDNVVFDQQLAHINKSKVPFFSTILTLTNHEPFELPGESKFGTKDNIQKFKSTAYFTDSCINDYLSKAKKQKWYKNTLFVFIADHGHSYPKNQYEIYEPERYHIP
ncbi:MAG: LTA synthase family protein, partial [Sphingobacteriaceae bacterium]|nr:LTA synthase family protein [Sphingobacteriaceae bacterium]